MREAAANLEFEEAARTDFLAIANVLLNGLYTDANLFSVCFQVQGKVRRSQTRE